MPHAGRSLGIALALAFTASTAAAMTPPSASAGWCAVSNGGKLPAASGGSAALCAAIEQAVAARGLRRDFSVRIAVGERSMLTVDVTLADGRTLPSLHLAQIDRAISRTTLEHFGESVANHVASGLR